MIDSHLEERVYSFQLTGHMEGSQDKSSSREPVVETEAETVQVLLAELLSVTCSASFVPPVVGWACPQADVMEASLQLRPLSLDVSVFMSSCQKPTGKDSIGRNGKKGVELGSVSIKHFRSGGGEGVRDEVTVYDLGKEKRICLEGECRSVFSVQVETQETLRERPGQWWKQ